MSERLGTPRLHLRQVDSTNLRARRLAAAGAPHGTLVTAGEQLAGRGRQGRAWSSPPGGSLSMSLVLRDPPALLSLAAGIAVAETVDTSLERSGSKNGSSGHVFRPAPGRTAPGAAIKWPNDILLDGRKVAGILVEAAPQEQWAVLGIGINVGVVPEQLPGGLRGRAGSLNLPPAAIEPTLVRLLEALERWLGEPAREILAAVRDRDALLGAPISWAQGSGVGAGIDDHGRLRVALPDGGERALDAGEVHLQAG